MLKDALSKDEEGTIKADFSFRNMLLLAIATSIDALAVGISLAFLMVNIWLAIALMGLVTFAFSAAGLKIGKIFGNRYKTTAEIAGGIILIFIGIKILFTHL
jgi:putative Mn2+ efflux pump MntP